MDEEADAWLDCELAGCNLADKRLRKLLAQIGSAMGESIPLVCQAGDDHLLRRKTGDPGYRDDDAGFAARAGVHAAFARDHECKHHGALSMLAGILTRSPGRSTPSLKTATAAESSSNPKLLDAAYPARTRSS